MLRKTEKDKARDGFQRKLKRAFLEFLILATLPNRDNRPWKFCLTAAKTMQLKYENKSAKCRLLEFPGQWHLSAQAVIFQICVAPSWQSHTLEHIFIFFPSVVFKEYAGTSPLQKKFPAQNPRLFKFLISVLLRTSDQSLPDSAVEFQIELKIDFNGQLSCVCVYLNQKKIYWIFI